jgi:thiamine-monophosphate kinase
MGGRPTHALVSVVIPPGGIDVDLLYRGLCEAAEAYDCPLVGGDLSAGPVLVLAVAVAGDAGTGGDPVRRSGARPGDELFVTGPLGASAAGLRTLREGGSGGEAHRRPRARVQEGAAARRAGATAMIDVSDGLATDARHLADASGVGVVVHQVPVASGATYDEALGGGEDYELLFTAPDRAAIEDAFRDAGLRAPIAIGRCTADASERRLIDRPLPKAGWEHRWPA